MPRQPELFGALEAVVLDEWHELMGSKRGVQTELCLSWLRQRRPSLRTWAISATIGNLEEAARAAVGVGVAAGGSQPRTAPDHRRHSARHGDPQPAARFD
jgi:ATP-dependent helicase Lhr and Lhr-like helicase